MNLESQIQLELTRMDDRMFLDKEMSGYGVYYTVKYRHDHSAPYTLLDWRQGQHPLPLSPDLLTALRQQEGDITDAIRDATVHNAVKKELDKQAAHREIDNVISEHQFENSGFKVGDATPRRRKRAQ